MDEFDPFNDPTLYEYKKIPITKQVKRLCRRMDLYALPITFRYKAEKKFYTNFGAMTSIILMITTIAFSVSYFREMFSDDRVSQQSVRKLILNREEVDNEGNHASFAFGFQILDENNEIFDYSDYSVLKPSMSTVENTWNNNTHQYEVSNHMTLVPLKCRELVENRKDGDVFQLDMT